MEARRPGAVGNVPAPTRSFVGRDRELEKISILLLGRTRLITLTGAGGIGKTRLAAEAIRDYRKAISRRTRVFWARLARLSSDCDATAMEEEIAHAVIDTDFSGRSVWDALVDTLAWTDTTGRTPHTVLVLDNCEHILTAAARVSADLLDAIPELTILATSREPLGWIDEHLVPVPPLTHHHALVLFQQRAELTGYSVTGTDQTHTAAEICRRVHNHPLYIQLAAARLVHQPLAMVLHGLTGHADDTRLGWSHGPRFGADPRHRGVIDVIAWSYELCSDKERLLFDRLSVFAAGYDTNPDDPTDTDLDVGADLDAIVTICCDDDTGGENNTTGVTLARHEIEHLLERLADISLATVHRAAATVRYSMVESLRVFAQYRLRQRCSGGVDEPARLAGRHVRYYRDKIAYAAFQTFRPEGQDLLDWARATWANTVTAIETSLATDQASAGLQICLGLITLRVPNISGSVREIRRWTERCLEATRTLTPQPIELQIGAMAAIAGLALDQGLPEDALQMLEECVTICIPDPETRVNWQHTAETDIGLPAPVEFVWGMGLFARRDARAITVLTRARDKFDALGDCGTASYSEVVAAMAAGLMGTAHQAHEITRRCLERAATSGVPRDKSWAEIAQAITSTKHGNPTDALAAERASLAYQLTVGDEWAGMWVVEFRTWSLARLITDSLAASNPDRDTLVALSTKIAHLAGGTKTLRARLGTDITAMGPLADESAKAVAVARQMLGPDVYTAAEIRGTRLRPEFNEVQRLALGTFAIDTASQEHALAKQAPPSRWRDLTPTERKVAILAAAKWTNTAIAVRRSTSVRTVDAQITTILHKLAIASREDIIEHIPRNVIDQVRTEITRRQRVTGRP